MLADERDKGGARGLVFAFAPSPDPHPAGRNRARLRRRALAVRQPDRRSRARSPCDQKGAPRSGCPGSSPSGLAGAPQLGPALDEVVRPSDIAPAVLSFQAGRIAAGGNSRPSAASTSSCGPNGARLGVLAPAQSPPGRYAFGLTGRDEEGETLEPGRYRVQLTASPPGKGRRARRRSPSPFVSRTARIYSPRGVSPLAAKTRGDQSDHRRGPSLTSPREPVRARPGSARKVGDVFKIDHNLIEVRECARRPSSSRSRRDGRRLRRGLSRAG